MHEEAPVKITRQNTWIQVETVIGVCVTVTAVTVSWALLSVKVSDLEARVGSMEMKYDQIHIKLDQIMLTQLLESQINMFRTGDRWTATMMEDFQMTWYDIIKQLHPEVSRQAIPDVRNIQKKFPQGASVSSPSIKP